MFFLFYCPVILWRLQLVHVSWLFNGIEERNTTLLAINTTRQNKHFWINVGLSFQAYIALTSSMMLTNCSWLTCPTAPPPQWENSRRNESSTHAWLIHPTDDSPCWSFYLSFWLNECFVCLKINTVDVPCQQLLLEIMANPKVQAWIFSHNHSDKQ